MATFGRFHILQELHRGPDGMVCLAKVAGDVVGARFVLKIYDASTLGLLESDAATQAFLDQGALQKQLASRGAQHWITIHELRSTPDGAFYVTDHYPLSAQNLILNNAELTERGLRRMVLGIVSGLLELKVVRGRAHGNLKPSNIFLTTAELWREETRVLLADPAAEAGSDDDRRRDLRALGELVFELVTRRPFDRAKDYPLKSSEEWGRLGSVSTKWRELCNWLLSDDPKQRAPDLDSVAVALRSIAPRRKPVVRRLAAALIVVAVLTATAGFFLTRLNISARSELDVNTQAWFSTFEQRLRDPTRRTLYRSDPHLAAVVKEIERAEAGGILFDPPDGESNLSLSNYRRNRAALEAVRKIEQLVTPDNWQALSELTSQARKFEQRGWKQPAAAIDETARRVRPSPGADLTVAIDRVLELHPRVTSQAAPVERAWTALDAELVHLRASGDPAIRSFGESLRSRAVAAVQLTDRGLSGEQQMSELTPMAARLSKVVRDGFPGRYGRERLASEVEARLNLVTPTPQDMAEWLEALPQYEMVDLGEQARPITALRQAFDSLVRNVARQPISDAEREQWKMVQSDLDARIATFANAKFLRKDIDAGQGEVALTSARLRTDIDALRKKWVRFEDPGEWLAELDQPIAVASDVIKNRWKAWVDALKPFSGTLGSDPKLFIAARAATERVRTALAELDEGFPQVPLGLDERYAATAWERREQQLTELSQWAKPAGSSVPATAPSAPAAEQVAEAGDVFAKFGLRLKELDADFPLAQEMLKPTDRPDQKWLTKDAAFWNDPAVQKLVANDVQRINRLAAVASLSRDDLVKSAAEAEAAEVALAAWVRLGDAQQISKPAWPTRKGELEKELELRRHVAGMVAKVKDAGRLDAEKVLTEQASERWRRYTNVADAAMVQTAARLRSDFRVSDAEIAKLEAPARFNLNLFLAHNAAGDGTDAVIRPAVAALLKSAEELKDRPQVAELPAKLARVDQPEPMAALVNTRPDEPFNLAIRGESPYVLQFIRVTAPGMRPFYLSTTEIALGMFVDLVNAGGSWTDVNALLGTSGPTPIVRDGPQAWQVPAASDQPISRHITWHWGNGKQFQFHESLRLSKFNSSSLANEAGGNPVYDHPMQHVTPQAALYVAALANCRLPTSREWQAAFDMEKRAGNPSWNLRDQTWRTQLELRTTTPQWPDAQASGVFVPKGMPRPSPSKVHEIRDGTLMFRTVTGTGGSVFLHLGGNVAELVCDAPDAFDTIPGTQRRTRDGILKFAQSPAASRIGVIGGSALSPPELELDKAYPVPSPTESWSDVGFRLAFTAPAKNTAERLKWVLEEQPYLVPVRDAE